MIIKIVNEELTALMGSENQKIKIASSAADRRYARSACRAPARPPTAQSWRVYYKNSRVNVRCSSACDVYRPGGHQTAASGWRTAWRTGLLQMGQTNPVEIAQELPLPMPSSHGNDMVFLDTAGRLHIDEALMDELKRRSKPRSSRMKFCLWLTQ